MAVLNFVPASRLPSGWRALGLGLSATALLASALALSNSVRRQAGLEAELESARPRPVPQLAPTRETAQRVQAASAAMRQLQLPVARLLKQVQAPRDVHVALLALDIQGKGAVKIRAEAETPQDMLNYVAWLGEQPLLRGVYLSKHDAEGGSLRFQLEAQWRE